MNTAVNANNILAVVVCLATTSIGAIYSSAATDMGAQVSSLSDVNKKSTMWVYNV